jgi:hypothetical protein
MTDQKKSKPPQEVAAEMHNENFQFVLKALLQAYQPILEQQLSLAKNPQELQKEAEKTSPNCADEIAEANRIFGKFFTEDVALRMIPAQNRNQLGPIENWRWCLQHLRCCVIFGWLVCRGPRTFRAWAYYVYQYWLCVRQSLGTPVANPPTEAQRQDFRTLVSALAVAYKPYLTDQLASVEFPAGIPDEVLNGQIDCFEGLEDVCTIFDRLLTTDAAQALLGKEAFAARSKDPNFWFCRCWCLCAICFGCCLARARSFNDVYWCLVYLFRCLADCFQPLRCQLTAPTGCTQEQQGLVPDAVAVEIDGTAAGAFFDHYTLEWRQAGLATPGEACGDDNTDYSSLGISYPGGGATGTIPVVGGTLGWLDTTTLAADSYEIRVCVYSTVPNALPTCCCTVFVLFKVMVWIDRVAELPGAPVQTPPGPFDLPAPPQAPIVNTNPGGIVVPVGGCISVVGTAWVGDCPNREIQCVDLRAAVGWQPGTAEPGFLASIPLYTIHMMLPTLICYTDPDPTVEAKKRASWNQLFETNLIRGAWVPTSVPPFDTQYCLPKTCFDSAISLPNCPDSNHACQSGKYTLLLDVTDTMGFHYYDTQQVWFDNKPIHVEFDGLKGVGPCQDVCLSKYAPPGAPCNTCWPMYLQGIAFDELIEPLNNSYPSNNFDYYNLSVTRQGGPTYIIPITQSLCPAAFGPDPLKGTQTVGEPGTRCEVSLGCPPPAFGPYSPNTLTVLDLRIFDAVCAADPSLQPPFVPPAGFPLNRGECCTYAFVLFAQDKTWSNGLDPSPTIPGSSGLGLHWATSAPWAVEVCNDLGSNVQIPQCP